MTDSHDVILAVPVAPGSEVTRRPPMELCVCFDDLVYVTDSYDDIQAVPISAGVEGTRRPPMELCVRFDDLRVQRNNMKGRSVFLLHDACMYASIDT